MLEIIPKSLHTNGTNHMEPSCRHLNYPCYVCTNWRFEILFSYLVPTSIVERSFVLTDVKSWHKLAGYTNEEGANFQNLGNAQKKNKILSRNKLCFSCLKQSPCWDLQCFYTLPHPPFPHLISIDRPKLTTQFAEPLNYQIIYKFTCLHLEFFSCGGGEKDHPVS